ncbi:unnamed protein product [Blepharisma stoltei]|uniref:Uncharacterized protein n=1 Tax=Blepharisma stoltei TaxID=1481888 RepID=A0AAU9JV64_9CILI|nr:unnamed protein product [Blepharisma stoltei]
MKSLISFIALIGLASCVSIGSKDSTLDPGRIVWPKETWVSSPIELGRANSGLTATITFNFRPSTALTSGYVEIILPSGLSGTLTATKTLSANTDTSASFPLVLPSGAAVYGPFGILTRTSSSGQIIDANYVFGCIATTASVTSSSTLTVTTVSGATSPVISTTDGIYFAFSLTQSFWRHDLIEIIPDSDWSFASSSVSCSSSDVTSVTNQLYGYDGTHNLPCALATSSSDTIGPQYTSTGSKSVYIYGVDKDVIIASSLSIKLKVSTFTLPGFVKSSSANTWTVKIWRFGTNNLLAKYSGSGPVTTAVGAVTVSSWKSKSGIDESIVPASTTLFSTVTFTNAHAIPNGGSAVITFTSVDISKDWWADVDATDTSGAKCFMSSSISATCANTDSTKVTISFTAALAASSSVSVTLLTALSSGAKISSIVTYYTGTTQIDALASSYSWPLSSTNKALGHFSYHAYADASNNYPDIGDASPTVTAGYLLGADKTSDLYWEILPNANVNWAIGTSISVNLPISSSLSYTSSYIAGDATVYDLVDPFTSAAALSTTTTGRTYSQSGNVITVSFTAAPTASNYLVFGYSGNSALPYVRSNLATFYECWAKATTSTTIEVGNSVFSVLDTDYANAGILTAPLCLSTVGAIPLMTTFIAKLMAMDFSSSTNVFTLEVTIAGGADLGTGLADKSDLPCDATVDGVTCTLTKINSGADSLITIKGLGTLAKDDSVSIYIAKGAIAASTSLTPTTAVYYQTSADSNIKNYLFTSKKASAYTTAAAVALTAATSTTTWTIGSSQTLAITGADVNANTATGTYIGIGLPAGFTLSGSAITAATKAPTKTYMATMSDKYSVGGFIMGIDDGDYGLSTGGSAMSITNIVAPGYAGATNGSNSIHFNVFVAANVGAACTASDISKITGNTISVGAITDVSCSSSASSLRGPDSVDSTMTVIVTVPDAVPKNGIVTLTMDTNWSYSSASCTVTGMTGTCVAGTSTVITASADFSAGAITVLFSHVLPPTSGSTATCVSAVTTQDANSNYIDSGSSLTQTINLAAAGSAGTSTITATAFPNFVGAASVDMYLSFTLSKQLPAGSVISISPGGVGSWLKSGDIKDYCWSNLAYSACTVTSSNVQVTLVNSLSSGSAVQLYLDSAITLPSSSGATSTGFQISATWSDVSIISDSSPGTVFTVNAAPAGAVTLTSVKINNVNNAGEAANYLFSFTSNQAVASGDYFIIQFPRDFDAYLGDADNTYPDCFPNDWYLTCSSTALGSVACAADHWYLKVSGVSKTATASSSLDLTVNGIRNPDSGTTGYFNIWHYGSTGTVKAYVNSAISVTTLDPVANSVTLKPVTVSGQLLSGSSTYSFDFYSAGTFSSSYSFEIRFPPQFNLKLANSGTTACTTKYYDDSGAANTDSTVAVDWSSGTTSCTADVVTGRVTLAIPSTVTKTFASTDRIRINLTAISNAQWGLSRSDSMWDNKDTSAFGSFSQWTNRFSVAAIKTTDSTISAKSYDILNAAYLGLNPVATAVAVNSYNPANGNNKIQLTPGTQSQDIQIVVDPSWPMKSKSLKLTAASNSNYPDSGNLEFTSVHHGYIVYQMTKTITFRVSAKTGTSQGLYYINWSPSESRQPGVSSDLYCAPLSVLVEVCTPSSTITPTVAVIPTLYKSHKSIPIAVTLARSPATDITITPSTTSTGISFNPTSLKFTKDSDVKYFEITVSSTYDSTQASPVIAFSISGTDAGAYGAIASRTVTVSSTDSTATQPTITIQQGTITGNSITLTVTSPQNGVLYWGFSCKGTSTPTFAELVAMAADLVSPTNATYSYQELKDMDYEDTETDIDSTKGDTDINSFFRRMHAKHCATYYTNAQVIYTGTSAQVVLDNLMGGTDYVFTAYVDNRLIESTSSYTAVTSSFSTSALPSITTTSVSFSGSVAQSSSDNIRNVLAKNMGVNPSWLTLATYTPPTSTRYLQDSTGTSTFIYNVLYDRALSASYPSNTIANNLAGTQATSEFASLYSYTTSAYATATASTGTTPSWTVAPASSTVGETSAAFTATSSQAGTIYVSCTDETSTYNTYAWQVIDGLNANSNPGYATYANSTAATSATLTVSGLTQGTQYQCYFTACNNYPLWPSCIDYSTSSSLVSVTIKTLTTDDGAAMLSLLAAFFLIFN